MSAGTIYPEQWSRNGDDSHNEVMRLLRPGHESGGQFQELTDLIETHADRHVLISSESLTTCMLRDEMCDALLAMIGSIQRLAPVNAVWTLRRLDAATHSFYVQMLLAGITADTSAKFMEQVSHERMFANMRRLEELVDDVTYVKYRPQGAHNLSLLRAFGLPDELCDRVNEAIRSSRRLNISYTHKQLAAVVNAQELSRRAGITLTREMLVEVFDRRSFRFEEDRPCELAGAMMRRELQERALECARSAGVSAYCDFFGASEIDAFPVSGRLVAEDLGDEDLDRLLTHLSQRSNREAVS